LLVILTTVLLSPVPVPAKDTDFSRPSNAGATIPLERLQRWSETVSGLGSVKVLALRRGSSAVGMRIESETDQSADAIEIDYAAREIRGFGLTFHSEYDGAGIPVGLTISNGSESVTLRPQPADSLADVERSAKTRLIKNFNGSNGPERVQQFMQLLRAARTVHYHDGRLQTNGFLGCIMDLVSITLDWVAVVASCGAPVVDLLTCVPSIIWATADTIRTAEAMSYCS
jgi:hypothetical protein